MIDGLLAATALDHNLIVLILTQPESWAQFNDRGELVVGDVPILTQPESWAQLIELTDWCPEAAFQSSPSPKAGRNQARCFRIPDQLWFQSSPSPKAGRNLVVPYLLCTLTSKFQSSPSPKAGRNVDSRIWISSLGCSNPHPARKLGAIAHLVHSACNAYSSPLFSNGTKNNAKAESLV